MNRRTILKYTALATGVAVSGPLMSIILSGCQSDAKDKALAGDFKPVFFSEKEMSLLRNLMDVILPKTDSPSATEVGVHKVMDSMVGEVYTAEKQAEFRKGFSALSDYLDKGGFADKKTAEQIKLLNELNASTEENLAAAKDSYVDVKQQTIAYYLSTEEIGTNFLNFLPIPGEYLPCISLEEAGGKLWTI